MKTIIKVKAPAGMILPTEFGTMTYKDYLFLERYRIEHENPDRAPVVCEKDGKCWLEGYRRTDLVLE